MLQAPSSKQQTFDAKLLVAFPNLFLEGRFVLDSSASDLRDRVLLWIGIITGANGRKKPLSPIVRKNVKAKIIIVSDAFDSYVSVNGKHTLENNRFRRCMQHTHCWVNRDECFVGPVTGGHTNRIEGAWEFRIKRQLKSVRGVRKELLAGYLDKFLRKTWLFAGRVLAPTCHAWGWSSVSTTRCRLSTVI
ncbi:uncharacterized protein IUM83_18621 [Phytophthora cinnamomi]|uniref:uncharacterized protein n=1 Tax=Phytophthora cinnamomi TaxID=4785 RepID=UPI003559A3AF|nr:hypothetical protein IUM83_18621 [Phytophthora cinnamomi]